MKDGEVIFTADEATGGTHMTLVLAGFLKKSFEEAEEYKKDKKNENDVFTIVKPVVQKMASIVKKYIQGYEMCIRDRFYIIVVYFYNIISINIIYKTIIFYFSKF